MVERPDSSALELATLDDTERLARQVANVAPVGALLVLTGPLGAGKTTFTRLLAAALGSTAQVSSPTYTLIHEYPTPHGPLVHIDAYRLEGADDLYALGLEDYLDRARLTVVEWGEALLENPEALWLELDFASPGADASAGTTPRRTARWRRSPARAHRHLRNDRSDDE